MGRPKKKSNAGRPMVTTPEVVKKLEEGFIQGMSDEEACLYAGISKHSLYAYVEKNPEFRDRKELLKKSVKLKARLNVNKAIQKGDLDTSKWYLERKAKNEFSTKVEQEIDANLTHVTIVDDVE